MVVEPVLCPTCGRDDVVKHGQSQSGKQRYKCRNLECNRSTFIRDYAYRGYLPDVKAQIADMALNGSGIRDTARVLKISPTTVIEELKKRSTSASSQSSTARSGTTEPDDCESVSVARGGSASR